MKRKKWKGKELYLSVKSSRAEALIIGDTVNWNELKWNQMKCHWLTVGSPTMMLSICCDV